MSATAAARKETAPGSERRRTHLLLAYWERIRAGRRFPTIDDLEPDAVKGLWPYCFVLKVGAAGALRFTHIGTSLNQGYGLLQAPDDDEGAAGEGLLEKATAAANRVVVSGQPLYDEGAFRNRWGDEVRYRCIVTPFSADQQHIDHLLGLTGYISIRHAGVPGLRVSTDYGR